MTSLSNEYVPWNFLMAWITNFEFFDQLVKISSTKCKFRQFDRQYIQKIVTCAVTRQIVQHTKKKRIITKARKE